ncbi:hypothetical protein I3843_02G093200 [Carya illinoinensis]|uniref:RRM domain-containing protein n=1 Tax=Carya illinoinensis TaxID=32201 RepID=A0A8T1RF18_CARIL|nr:heterogeneous nuclear ribonucleoprotein 1-like [Carya illinoinensis]KAG2721993.1 hypothetical protein I3760_02G108300 [Carya illinoinensis]KAG2721994.1 hypothetical protein I3760_02G108300 [Carya illinoinensis]KAG6664642.1 hypothetical protein CIPAW_02G108200 [Carya illinoinensis]KAG6726953.1 hypothetical protein I3842_02G106700 [Carya illinoinensis]KAG6726955.1 hypothetical protein I3842_02G106700 [Carya illinoinensis]
MDSDQGKLFIGGISWETTEEKLKDYFENYGDVIQTVVMRDKTTGRPRGFGFVVFADPSVLDRVLLDIHTIDGRTVEAKRALSREEQQTSAKAGNPSLARSSGGGGTFRTKKIFVGGLPATLSEEGFRQHFETYGHVTDVVVMYDQNTGRPRGFGFITFDTEEAVDRVLHKNFHDLDGKQVEVKRALPKDANPGGGSRSMGGGAGGGGSLGSGYQNYGASGGNPNAYDGRMESNRYMQPQSTGGGFGPYGSSGYSTPGYGYGPANNGISYGGYAGANTGYGGPAGAAYGNPNIPSAGFGSGPPGAPRSSWSTQSPTGYGALGYGNTAAWGAPTGSTGAPSGGPGSAPTGQSPSGATGYGNQSYGYGGYGGSDGSYGNPGGYGAVGGRSGSVSNNNAGGPGGGDMQGSGGGYMGSGYGDANGNPGYGNAAWRSEQSQTSGNYGAPQGNGPHGGQVAYGGGYGSAQARTQQQ